MREGLAGLLNRAARFFPILKELKKLLSRESSLLEVGSGPLGLGEFWKKSFVGCDVIFPFPPIAHMRAVRSSGHELPFAARSFDAVVVSDVLEHVPPDKRSQVVAEALRVARGVVVFAYPCGSAAFALDQRLYQDLKTRKVPPPEWLEEHMVHAFPDERLFSEGIPGWTVKVIPNETLIFHYWMIRSETYRICDYAFRLALRIAPRLVERLLQRMDREPSYRKIFILKREPQLAHD